MFLRVCRQTLERGKTIYQAQASSQNRNVIWVTASDNIVVSLFSGELFEDIAETFIASHTPAVLKLYSTLAVINSRVQFMEMSF